MEQEIIHDSMVYLGSFTLMNSALVVQFAATGIIVLHLTNRILLGLGYEIFFDNYFTFIPLLIGL